MTDTPKPAKTSLWVSSTYFAEGLPYIVVRFMSTVFFTDLGVREAFLCFINFFGIPWNLKFLWAPLLDIYSTKRTWMIRVQALITIAVLVIAVLAGLTQSGTDGSMLKAAAFLFIVLAFLSATNDIAIDAYYMEGLTDKSDQAAYSGLRIMAYRIAVIYARTVLVAIAGLANWFWGFAAGSLTMGALVVGHALFLPRFERERSTRPRAFAETLRMFGEAFRSYLRQPRMALVLSFIITYPLGDQMLFAMSTPFLMRELGVTKLQIAWLGGFVGAISAIVGALIGSWWIKKVSLRRAIWPIVLFMNLNIWAYIALAYFRPQAATTEGLVLIAAVHGYENIAAGLGNVALMIYLMRLCAVEFKAAHFAIGSAIMSLGANVIGGFSGIIVEHFGYVHLFIAGFCAAIPSMVLLGFIPLHEPQNAPPAALHAS
jgi:MFS transporter, PAT family, beta-lactamase induction signal transducer AmpG